MIRRVLATCLYLAAMASACVTFALILSAEWIDPTIDEAFGGVWDRCREDRPWR